MRLTTLGLIRCFSQMLPNISETLKNNISLQLVSLESIMEIGQSQNSSRMPNQMRGLAFSVFSQARRYVLHLFLGNLQPRIFFICEFSRKLPKSLRLLLLTEKIQLKFFLFSIIVFIGCAI